MGGHGTIGGGVIQEHPTVMTSQPEIFNRNEDEEIDDEDDSRYDNNRQHRSHYQDQHSDSYINQRAAVEDQSKSYMATRGKNMPQPPQII